MPHPLHALRTGALLAMMTLTGLQVHAEPVVKAAAVPAGPTATLTLADAQARLTVAVDGAGSYTDALLEDAGGAYLGDLAFRSMLLFNGEMPLPDLVKQVDPATARSRFSAAGAEVSLLQRLEAGPMPGTFLLTQQYRLHNPGAADLSLVLSRYHDSDLIGQNGLHTDAGYLPRKKRWAYLMSELAPQASVMTKFVGINLAGGDEPRRVVRVCCDRPPVDATENGVVAGDDNGDRVSDYAGDRTLMQQRSVTIPAGGTTRVVTQALLGAAHLSGVRALPQD